MLGKAKGIYIIPYFEGIQANKQNRREFFQRHRQHLCGLEMGGWEEGRFMAREIQVLPRDETGGGQEKEAANCR